ncbi:OLC1v1030699C1 [Oldenlandia corymbosa var. corymbosa]|uniref:OLC1v1030699C1 n=1 Tax=Oldenlandia corymbosa var. corymbosa TaxID=529605 RepID=A0AAV1CIL4_OLDCO|nr:OLC1v1030699C1 [Oldenlandia corymbosa var. corymbosa]
MATFLRKLSPDILRRIAKANKNDFWIYVSHWEQLFVTAIPLSAVLAIPMALYLPSGWGRKPTLILGSFCLLAGSILLLWFPSPSVARGDANSRIRTRNRISDYSDDVCGNRVPCHRTKLIWSSSTWFGLLGFVVEAEKELKKLRRYDSEVNREFEDLAGIGIGVNKQVEDLCDYRSRPALLIDVAVTFMSPLMGAGALMFFGALILQSVGFKSHVSFLGPLIASVCGICAARISTFFLNRFGRRIPTLLSFFIIFISKVMHLESLFSLGEMHNLSIQVVVKKPFDSTVEVSFYSPIWVDFPSAAIAWTTSN